MSHAPPEQLVSGLRAAIGEVWWGSTDVLDLVLTSVLAGGHLLLEDVPGVGKTTLAAALARAIGGAFSRVQFTSDLLPSDVTGMLVLGVGGELRFREGPIFANVVLADEINRTTPRTQSALLEAMGEAAVTVDGQTRALPRPFLVVATQNPFDFQGTYPLPESQLDRFLMRISLGYPSRTHERLILRQAGSGPGARAVCTPEALQAAISAVADVRCAAEVEEYLLDLVWATRTDPRLLRGASPRGAQALARACRARAVVAGRRFVIPDDVRSLAAPVLGHRVVARGAVDGGAAVISSLLQDLHPPG